MLYFVLNPTRCVMLYRKAAPTMLAVSNMSVPKNEEPSIAIKISFLGLPTQKQKIIENEVATAIAQPTGSDKGQHANAFQIRATNGTDPTKWTHTTAIQSKLLQGPTFTNGLPASRHMKLQVASGTTLSSDWACQVRRVAA